MARSQKSKASQASKKTLTQSQDSKSNAVDSVIKELFDEDDSEGLPVISQDVENEGNSTWDPFVMPIRLTPLQAFRANIYLNGFDFIFDLQKDVEKRMQSTTFKIDYDKYLAKKRKSKSQAKKNSQPTRRSERTRKK